LGSDAAKDHIGAVSDLIQKYKIPFYLNKKDEKLLKQANLYKILFESKESVVIPSFDRDFGQESAKFSIGNFFIEIVSTPGHTPGSVCIQVGKNIFVGDTLLSSGPGSTHLPGGNQFEMDESINKLQKLPEDLCVYPGHGRPFTLNFFWNKYFAPKS
jgi:hydroxyacylglutathione hydrolase